MRKGCMSRMLDSCGERAFLRRLQGKDDTPDDLHLRFKALSFYDFDEDKTLLNSSMHFDSDGDETESEFHSVDEGAIAVLSMDEIRNMRNLQLDYEQTLKDSRAFVNRRYSEEDLDIEIGSDKVQDNGNDNLQRIIGYADVSKAPTPRTSANSHIYKEMTGRETPCIDSL